AGGSRYRRRPDPHGAWARTSVTGAWVPQDSGTGIQAVDDVAAQQAQSAPDADARDDLDVARGLAEPRVDALVGPALAPRAPAAPGRRSGVSCFPPPSARCQDRSERHRREGAHVDPQLQMRP